jgi:hypothetical protein
MAPSQDLSPTPRWRSTGCCTATSSRPPRARPSCTAPGSAGPLVGRPWLTTGYGLGLMLGSTQRAGMPQPVRVIGHSASGPGSVGAVYHTPDDSGRTVAAFAAGSDDGAVEVEVLRHLAGDRRERPATASQGA